MKINHRILALLLCLAMAIGLCACGGGGQTGESNPPAGNSQPAAQSQDPGQQPDDPTPEHLGTIMWLSNLTSGVQYEAYKAYGAAICAKLGYDFTIVYGDSFNDAAGNLTAVSNGMTNDVVGLIVSQDGGVDSIMEQYPDLYVTGFNTDMTSVFNEGGPSAGVLSNDHFLGTICDGFADGANMGNQYFDAVVEKGYHRVSIVNFPGFAYPNQIAAVQAFLGRLEGYNATAADADKITLVGEPLTLEFQPLSDAYFLEDGMNDLDCVVAFCAGVQFVYPTLVTAKLNGTCRMDTQMITGGFDNNADIIADIGEDKTISWICFAPAEDLAYPLVLLDNAITGNLPADFAVDQMDSAAYIVDSQADIDNVMSRSMNGTAQVALAQLTVDEVVSICGRNNPNYTFADLQALFHSAQVTVDGLQG